MMDSVAEGREAWTRLRRVGKTAWADWLLVARALEIGRASSLKVAQTNQPYGKKYTAAMALWLRENGFEELTQQERTSCHRVMENLPAIEKWRRTLSADHVRRLNHPDSSYWGWKQDAASASRRHVQARSPRRGYSGNIHFPQDTIRRVAQAMRDNWTNDTFKLARVALEAAIRNEADIDELFAAPKPKPAPVMAVSLHA